LVSDGYPLTPCEYDGTVLGLSPSLFTLHHFLCRKYEIVVRIDWTDGYREIDEMLKSPGDADSRKQVISTAIETGTHAGIQLNMICEKIQDSHLQEISAPVGHLNRVSSKIFDIP
jgi:hypothetical protein